MDDLLSEAGTCEQVLLYALVVMLDDRLLTVLLLYTFWARLAIEILKKYFG